MPPGSPTPGPSAGGAAVRPLWRCRGRGWPERPPRCPDGHRRTRRCGRRPWRPAASWVGTERRLTRVVPPVEGLSRRTARVEVARGVSPAGDEQVPPEGEDDLPGQPGRELIGRRGHLQAERSRRSGPGRAGRGTRRCARLGRPGPAGVLSLAGAAAEQAATSRASARPAAPAARRPARPVRRSSRRGVRPVRPGVRPVCPGRPGPASRPPARRADVPGYR